MLSLLIVFWVLTALYVLLMLMYAKGWRLQDDFIVDTDFVPATKISIIIPARNEAQNITACIQSILNNDYPAGLFEIIVIDDHSTDNTFEKVKNFGLENVLCLRLADVLKENERVNAYKKKAIETGIAQSSGNLIITTDADCILPEAWLKNIAAVFQKQLPVMIAGPVSFFSDNRIVSIFQSLDFMSLQGITGAAHRLRLGNMSNGANLAFSKSAFYEVNGYEGVDHLASGDDYLLMMKMQKRFPGKIAYLKSESAIAKTAPQPNWKSFLNQRIRWASKSGKYDDKKLTGILSLVYLFNFSFFILLIAGFWNPFFWLLFFGILFIKIAVEIYFLIPVAEFYDKRKELLWFPFLQPLHIAYIIAAGFLGFVGAYQWKGRKVK